MAEKTDYLVCYDYGTGGVWAIIRAQSEDEITAKYPEFDIFKETPSWMDKTELADIAAKMTFDIEDKPSGWLEVLVRERNKTA